MKRLARKCRFLLNFTCFGLFFLAYGLCLVFCFILFWQTRMSNHFHIRCQVNQKKSISFWKIIIISDRKFKKTEMGTRVQTRAHDKIYNAQSNEKKTVKRNCDISLIRSYLFILICNILCWSHNSNEMYYGHKFLSKYGKFLRKFWLTYLWNMAVKIPSTLT